jgi:hypothetical protein
MRGRRPKEEILCGHCGGDPNSDGHPLDYMVFMGNMTEEEAYKHGYVTSGAVKGGLYHAYATKIPERVN